MTLLYSWLIDPSYGAVLGLLLKVSALLALTGLVASGVSRFQAARRHLIWTLGLIAALLLLPLTSVSPKWAIEIARTPVSALRTPTVTETTLPPAATNGARSEGSPGVLAEGASAAPGTDVRRVLLLAWFAGTATFLVYTLIGHVALRLMARRGPFTSDAAWETRVRSAAQRLGMRTIPRVHVSDSVTIPLTFGFLRPVLLLPSAAHGWTEARKHVVLLHELAHIARRDALTQLFAALACAAYWFHPLVWFGATRMRVERERACDDLVVAAGTEPTEYASHLLDIATTARPLPANSFAALAMARPSQLEGRLLAILNQQRSIKPARPRSFPAVLAFACVACITAPVAALRIVPSAEAEATPKQTPRTSIVQPSGRIQLPRVDNGGVFRTGSGDIYIGAAVGPLELQTGNGHIRVESLRGALNARTARGDVTVMAFDETVPFTDAIKIVAERGNVTLLLPEHFSGELDVETQARPNERPTTILSDFPIDIRTSVTRAGNEEFEVRAARATIGGGTATVTIRARFGNVVVRRTNAPQ